MSEANQSVPEATASSPPTTPEPASPRPDRPWARLWARLGTRPWLRPLLVIGGIVTALSLITTLVVVVDFKSGGTYQSGSPEATVMSWTSALKSGDYATADTYLSTYLKRQGSTSRSISRNSMGMPIGTSSMNALEYSIVSSSIQGSTATVVVQMKMTTAGTIGLSNTLTVLLVQETGTWKIDYVRSQYGI